MVGVRSQWWELRRTQLSAFSVVVEMFIQLYMTGGSSCLLLAQLDLVMQRPVVIVSTGVGHLINK